MRRRNRDPFAGWRWREYRARQRGRQAHERWRERELAHVRESYFEWLGWLEAKGELANGYDPDHAKGELRLIAGESAERHLRWVFQFVPYWAQQTDPRERWQDWRHSVWSEHRERRFWPDAGYSPEFRLDRLLRGDPWETLPRGCMVSRFAQYEQRARRRLAA